MLNMILPLMRYFEISGRSRRTEYWAFTLAFWAVALALIWYVTEVTGAGVIEQWEATDDDRLIVDVIFSLPGIALISFFLFTLIPTITVTIRRFHDINLSGWWLLGILAASAIPYIGILFDLVLLVIMLAPGTKGDNTFGADPREFSAAELMA